VVLLSVLLILAILSALTYQLVGRQSLLVAQARQTFAGDQALQYALGAETFARQVLRQEWEETGAVDMLSEVWAQAIPPMEVDEGFIEIQVTDLNRCFNLNSVAAVTPGGGQQQGGVQPGAQPPGGQGANQRENLNRFKTLLRNLNVPETIADQWLDWIDPDQEIGGFGAEDGEYLLREFAHRTADQYAGDVSELRMLAEMEPDYYELIAPHVCALPTDELKLNVNTATPEALAALNPALSAEQFDIVDEAGRAYQDVNEITGEIPDLAAATDALSVASEYFEVQVRAQVDDALVEMSSILHRGVNDGTITLLSRNFGKNFRSRFLDDLIASED
jgi:general secretion pathway protein K